MIREPTVFVVGAGGHCPYGFPDGHKLLDNMIACAPPGPGHQTHFSKALPVVLPDSYPPNFLALRQFGEALRHCGQASIDSFLATHAKKPYFSDIGKLMVAWELMPHEFSYKFDRSPIDGDWLSYLFNYMVQGCLASAEDFIANNHASFVTFNYDRTLEYFLTTRLMHTYGLAFENALKVMQEIPIIHIYGSLGVFRTAKQVNQGDLTKFPQQWKAAAESINLMYEDRASVNQESDAAKVLLNAARRICFLGFSFDPDNIKRLSLDSYCHGKNVVASRYKVADGEWSRAKAAMGPTDMEPYGATKRDWDALTVLRESKILA